MNVFIKVWNFRDYKQINLPRHSRDSVALAEKVGWLFRSPDQGKILGQAGRWVIKQDYSMGAMVAKTEQRYSSLWEKKESQAAWDFLWWIWRCSQADELKNDWWFAWQDMCVNDPIGGPIRRFSIFWGWADDEVSQDRCMLWDPYRIFFQSLSLCWVSGADTWVVKVKVEISVLSFEVFVYQLCLTSAKRTDS